MTVANQPPTSDVQLAAAVASDKIIAKRIKARGRHAHYSDLPALEFSGPPFTFPMGYDHDTPVPGYPHVWEINGDAVAEDARVPQVPKSFRLQQLFVLHLFRGQRRAGDLQDHLDTMLSGYAGLVWVLSIDIVNDKVMDNLMREDVVARWTSLIIARAVLALFAGPPCETFSVIRGLELEDGTKGPPPLRKLEQLCGLIDVIRKQSDQLITGNTLYCTAIILSAAAARHGCAALLEHPEEASWKPDHPSSWRIPQTMKLIARSMLSQQGLIRVHAERSLRSLPAFCMLT